MIPERRRTRYARATHYAPPQPVRDSDAGASPAASPWPSQTTSRADLCRVQPRLLAWRWCWRLPGIDVGAFLFCAGGCGGEAAEAGYYPVAGFGGVDYVVDAEVEAFVDGFGPFVAIGHHLVEFLYPLVGVFDGGEVFAVAELDAAFDVHAGEFGGWPSRREEGHHGAAAAHGLGAESVGFADDEGEHGDV